MKVDTHAIDCFYYGSTDKGRGWHSLTNRITEKELPPDFPINHRAADGGMLPPRMREEEGSAELIHFPKWTALTFWDRTLDMPHGTASTFVIRGWVSFSEAVQIAKEQYPQIFERFWFNLMPRAANASEPESYAMKHLARHLYESGDFEKLLIMINNMMADGGKWSNG